MVKFAAADSPGGFLVKRAIRIVPLYWLVTIAMCVGAELAIFRNFTYDLPSLLKSLLFIPYYSPEGQVWPLVVVGWTLNLEVFFYICFAIALGTKSPKLTLAVLMIGMVALGRVLDTADPILATWTSPLLLEFVAGCAIAHVGLRAPRAIGASLFVAGFAILILSEFTPIDAEAHRLLVWGVPAIIIVFGAVSLEPDFKKDFLALRALRMIGDWSYSLYLTHGFLVAGVHRFLGDGVLPTILILVSAIFIAWVSYEIVERGVSKRLRRIMEGRTSVV